MAVTSHAQISTFWAMLADRKWDDLGQLVNGRRPRSNYLVKIRQVYDLLKEDEQLPTSRDMREVIEDLYCFNGWEVSRRLRRCV